MLDMLEKKYLEVLILIVLEVSLWVTPELAEMSEHAMS